MWTIHWYGRQTCWLAKGEVFWIIWVMSLLRYCQRLHFTYSAVLICDIWWEVFRRESLEPNCAPSSFPVGVNESQSRNGEVGRGWKCMA